MFFLISEHDALTCSHLFVWRWSSAPFPPPASQQGVSHHLSSEISSVTLNPALHFYMGYFFAPSFLFNTLKQWTLFVGFYLLRFPSESLMVFFTSSFPGVKNLSFSEPKPLIGILSFLFSKSLMLTSIHFCCHISRCQTQESPPVSSVTSAITTSCSRKVHGGKKRQGKGKRKSKISPGLPKPPSQLGRALEQKPVGSTQALGGHLQQLCRASVQGRIPVWRQLGWGLQLASWRGLLRAGVPGQDTAACSAGEPQAA